MSVSDFVATPGRQVATLRETEHRPWALPQGSWLMAQTWDDLLFEHWRVSVDALRSLIPSSLDIDTFDGDAWLGITPFRLTGLRLRGVPPVPRASSFCELNVRTYVRQRGERPGIWFFSLDASRRYAVQAARRFYRLPYFLARMSADTRGTGLAFSSSRRTRGGRPFTWSATYAPSGATFTASPGSLEYFLAERYCLYTLDRGRLLGADIHHPPWPLQPAEATIELNTMPPPGVELPADEPLLHFARRQDVVIWPLEELPAARPRSADLVAVSH